MQLAAAARTLGESVPLPPPMPHLPTRPSPTTPAAGGRPDRLGHAAVADRHTPIRPAARRQGGRAGPRRRRRETVPCAGRGPLRGTRDDGAGHRAPLRRRWRRSRPDRLQHGEFDRGRACRRDRGARSSLDDASGHNDIIRTAHSPDGNDRRRSCCAAAPPSTTTARLPAPPTVATTSAPTTATPAASPIPAPAGAHHASPSGVIRPRLLRRRRRRGLRALVVAADPGVPTRQSSLVRVLRRVLGRQRHHGRPHRAGRRRPIESHRARGAALERKQRRDHRSVRAPPRA